MSDVFIVRAFGNKRPVIKKNKEGVPEIEYVDFDRVETELIKPAMAQLGLSGGTTGEVHESGEIREDMFSELLLAKIVIADITIYNANVYYELGVRHALRNKRTVLIQCPGYDEAPFDIKGYRYITYNKDNPGDALNELVLTLKATLDAERVDSPVFNMLPKLEQQDLEKFHAVPEEFGEEVVIATKAGMIGKLKLLMSESAGFDWENLANKYLGESFFKLKVLEEGRILWEKVKAAKPTDSLAYDRLSTIYQRLAENEFAANPVRSEEYLTKSDQAIDFILKGYKNLEIAKRAEVFALKARNAKARWIQEWDNLPADKKEKTALVSKSLDDTYTNYERGFYEDLNHFYSGINALSILKINIILAKKYPSDWGLLEEDDENKKTDKLEIKFQKLKDALQFSLDAQKRRLKAAAITDRWFDITLADFTFLTSADTAKVSLMYKRALTGAENFYMEAAEKQIKLFEKLNCLTENVLAAFTEFPAKTASWGQTYYLLFTGHMIDKADRPAPRFPASKENEVKNKIREKVTEVQSKLKAGFTITGIAGGACGGDILFHEVCKEMGIKTQMFLAMAQQDFITASVAFAGANWIERFEALTADTAIPKFELYSKNELPKWLKKKAGYTIWKRNTIWEFNSAMVNGGANMSLIALWDGKGGDGEGGTEDMVNVTKENGAKTWIIDMNTV
jgi:hypothetical protein